MAGRFSPFPKSYDRMLKTGQLPGPRRSTPFPLKHFVSAHTGRLLLSMLCGSPVFFFLLALASGLSNNTLIFLTLPTLISVILSLFLLSVLTAYFHLKKLSETLRPQLLAEEKKHLEADQEAFAKIVALEAQSAPHLAYYIADFQLMLDNRISSRLERKERPAYSAAEEVRKIAASKRDLLAKLKMFEYQCAFYEAMFPWLEDFKEAPIIEAFEYAGLSDATYDRLRYWLSPEEYQTLTSTQKNQLALTRYVKRNKSPWEIGIEYERYIGYVYEQRGYRVRYSGATMGLEDMGRDLVATKDGKTLVIQCKRWSQEKTIHEKHIFQLFGSVTLMQVEKPGEYIPLFITSATLSDTAKACAQLLNVDVVENHPFKQYPLIKCNISKDGEKIYHLPFDQQYDRVIINSHDGDTYAKTVAEAEALGFRHAYRWQSAN